MENQNVKKAVSSNDCTVLILGANSTGKITLFKELVKYNSQNLHEYKNFFLNNSFYKLFTPLQKSQNHLNIILKHPRF
jgi:hypothetical protein